MSEFSGRGRSRAFVRGRSRLNLVITADEDDDGGGGGGGGVGRAGSSGRGGGSYNPFSGSDFGDDHDTEENVKRRREYIADAVAGEYNSRKKAKARATPTHRNSDRHDGARGTDEGDEEGDGDRDADGEDGDNMGHRPEWGRPQGNYDPSFDLDFLRAGIGLSDKGRLVAGGDGDDDSDSVGEYDGTGGADPETRRNRGDGYGGEEDEEGEDGQPSGRSGKDSGGKSAEEREMETRLKIISTIAERTLPTLPADADPDKVRYYKDVDDARIKVTLSQMEDDGTNNAAQTPDERRIRQNLQKPFSLEDSRRTSNNDIEGFVYMPIPHPSEEEAIRHLGKRLKTDEKTSCILCQCAAISENGSKIPAWLKLMDIYINSSPAVEPHETAKQIAAHFNEKTRLRVTQYVRSRLIDKNPRATKEDIERQMIGELPPRMAYDHFKFHMTSHEVDCINRIRFLTDIIIHLELGGVFREDMKRPGSKLVQEASLSMYLKTLAARDAVIRSMSRESFNSLRYLRDAMVTNRKA